MRKMIFRGKLHNDGRWIAWSLLGAIFADKNIEVDFETVGQYTGLTDKNGKKIFEGDIVKVTDDNGETDLCSCGVGEVCFYDGVWYIGDEVNDGLYDVNKIYYVEVIGNIHDNPELLKGE
jgi:uncharacterized phage protein (TIGR01671 family)